jgi:hypothetical protein
MSRGNCNASTGLTHPLFFAFALDDDAGDVVRETGDLFVGRDRGAPGARGEVSQHFIVRLLPVNDGNRDMTPFADEPHAPTPLPLRSDANDVKTHPRRRNESESDII